MNRTSVPFVLYVLFVLLSIGCGSPKEQKPSAVGAAPAQASGGGRALIYALAHDATTLDPSEATDIESGTVMQQIYEGLLTFGPSDTKLYPALAQSYEISDDGTMWTFHLRHGVKFHDGTPFDAEAVRFSFERMIDENHPYHLPGRMTYAPTVLGNFVKHIDTPDTHTVIITLNAPYTPFGHNLAMVPASIVSPTAMKKAGRDNFGNEPCGTGPFRLARWRRDNEILLERNPDYWGEPAASQRVYFKIIPDGNVRYSSLIRGDVHIIVGVEIAYMDKLRADPKFNLFEQPGFNTGYIILNNNKPPLNDERVRRALNYAINKDYIVNTVFRGTSVVAHGVLPPGMLGFNPNLEGYGYDPEKARELLKEAGYPNGFSITMSTTVTPRPYNPAGIKLAEVVQGHLRDVGVEVKLRQLDFGTLLD
ncbi:MAG: ABC transporter substrate-binding protein, partial [bacterium]